jgi:transposase
MSYRND